MTGKPAVYRPTAEERAKLWTALLNSSEWLYDIEEETSSVELEAKPEQRASTPLG